MADFFTLSKIAWFLLAPDHLLIWGYLLAALLLLCGWRRFGATLLTLLLSFSLLLMLFPLSNVVMSPLEKRFAQYSLSDPTPVQGIVILGGGEMAQASYVWNSPQFNQAAERFMVVPELARRYPQARIIFSGGSGDPLHQEFRGADVAKDWFEHIGLGERIELERDSRNTYENARNTIAMLGGVPQGRWLLVTSGFHMPRSIGIFRQQGWDITPYPVDFYSLNESSFTFAPGFNQHMQVLTIAVREWIGLAAYYWSGKTASLFPAPAVKETES